MRWGSGHGVPDDREEGAGINGLEMNPRRTLRIVMRDLMKMNPDKSNQYVNLTNIHFSCMNTETSHSPTMLKF